MIDLRTVTSREVEFMTHVQSVSFALLLIASPASAAWV
jgi:hypothetical protein